jgi:small multidrug resistance family-3 protein
VGYALANPPYAGAAVEKLVSLGILIAATLLEAGGDALVRMGLAQPVFATRMALFLAGATSLFAYGVAINLAPFEFGRVIGLYIATFFVSWQIINRIAFGAVPNLPILVGGALIVSGGLIVTFWNPR